MVVVRRVPWRFGEGVEGETIVPPGTVVECAFAARRACAVSALHMQGPEHVFAESILVVRCAERVPIFRVPPSVGVPIGMLGELPIAYMLQSGDLVAARLVNRSADRSAHVSGWIEVAEIEP